MFTLKTPSSDNNNTNNNNNDLYSTKKSNYIISSEELLSSSKFSSYDYDNSVDRNSSSSDESLQLSLSTYNLLIGSFLLYGFFVNLILINTCYDFVFNLNFFTFLIGYFVSVFIGIHLVRKSESFALQFTGYNLIVIPLGLVLTLVLNTYIGFGFQDKISVAFGITGSITVLMMILSSIMPEFFLNLGKTLFISLIFTIIASFVSYAIGTPLAFIDYILVCIFSGYIGYDWAKANAKEKTAGNALLSASELYIDLVNLFLRILRILARSSRS